MKVLLVTSDFPWRADEVVGGVAGVSAYLTEAYQRIPGVEVEVLHVSPAIAGDVTREQTIHGARVRRLGRRPGLGFYGSVLWGLPRAVTRAVSEAACDVVHVQGMERVAARLDRPSVLTIHGLNEVDTRYRGRRWLAAGRAAWVGVLARRARRRVLNVIAINPFVRQFLEQRSPQRVWEIANPVLDSFFGVKRELVPGRILAAARISPLKNTAGLIRAFRAMAHRHPEAQLRLAGVGGGSYEASCRALVHESGLAGRVHFLGSLSVAALQAELARAACLALTSLHENAPLVISEAQAAGVPVVASRVGGIPHMIDEGRTGRLVEPRDPEDLARGLEQLLYADDLSRLGRRARAAAEQRYRAAVVAERTLDVYREILGWPQGASGLGRGRPLAQPVETALAS